MCCECQSSSENELAIIQELLKDEQNDSLICPSKYSWLSQDEINLNSNKPNRASLSRNNNNSYRSYFGYKANNKVNNYQFKVLDNVDRYMEHYRSEHKSFNCLSGASERTDSFKYFSYEQPDRNKNNQRLCTNEIEFQEKSIMEYTKKLELSEKPVDQACVKKSDVTDKSIVQQVKFWQSQNSRTSPSIENIDSKNLEGLQLVNSQPITSHTSKTNNHTGNRSMNVRRAVDVYIPQGTTYDLLTEDSRFGFGYSNDNTDKVTPNVAATLSSSNLKNTLDGVPNCLFTQPLSREPTRCVSQCYTHSGPPKAPPLRRFTHNGGVAGGTLEFAKLLDERLQKLYDKQHHQQQPDQTYQKPPIYIQPNQNPPRKESTNQNIPRPSSANQNQSSPLLNLAVSGVSACKVSSSSKTLNKTSISDLFRIDITGRCYLSLKQPYEYNK